MSARPSISRRPHQPARPDCAVCSEALTPEDHDPARHDGMCAPCRAHAHTIWAADGAAEFADCRCAACLAHSAGFAIAVDLNASRDVDPWAASVNSCP